MLRRVLGGRLAFEFRVVRVVVGRGRNGKRERRWWGIDRGRGMMLSLFGLISLCWDSSFGRIGGSVVLENIG